MEGKIGEKSVKKHPGSENLTPGGPGRPPGQKNYATIYKEALQILADKNATTPEKLEAEMIANAAVLARKGDYRFYKDLMDRKYGQAVSRSENTNLNADLHKLQDEEKQRLDDLIK